MSDIMEHARWSNMKANQRILNARIMKDHGVDEETVWENLKLSTSCEIMEYANTTRCFKHWSTKDPDPEAVRLEEFVDGIHFYLTYFIILNIETIDIIHAQKWIASIKGDKNSKLRHHLQEAMRFLYGWNHTEDDAIENTLYSFAHFMAAGEADGFDPAVIEKAYYVKCQENHKRQDNGY